MNNYNELKGVSPLIATIIVISLAFMLGALIAPYTFNLVSNTTITTGDDVRDTIRCRNLAYDFVTSYGTNGIVWNFSTNITVIEARIINTGTQNIYNFSFELYVNTSSGDMIYYYDTNSTFQKTESSPLKPGQSTIIKAGISEDLNGTLKELKIRNEACPEVFINQEL